jgi:hypothetical protein
MLNPRGDSVFNPVPHDHGGFVTVTGFGRFGGEPVSGIGYDFGIVNAFSPEKIVLTHPQSLLDRKPRSSAGAILLSLLLTVLDGFQRRLWW